MTSQCGSLANAGCGPEARCEERLERGELLFFPTAPFALPGEADRKFLCEQELAQLGHKNISLDPETGKLKGLSHRSAEQEERVGQLLAQFSRNVTDWLVRTFPRYASGIKPDRATFRPEEEATRRLRHTARNDLIHVDAFRNRPSQGARILRIYANLNDTEPRIWVTSEPFARLLARFGQAVGLPGQERVGWLRLVRAEVSQLLRRGTPRRSAYDAFMLRFHHFLKHNEDFQERCPRRLWTFPPGSAWVLMADACSHAVLRGRFALEHSFFISPEVLALPEESPAALLTFASLAAGPPRAA
jgi:hypothetical protein